MSYIKCTCAACDKEFEGDLPEEDHNVDLFFCQECVSSGRYIEGFVKKYKVMNNIPKDEAVMVKCDEEGIPVAYIREKDMIEQCKKSGMDPTSYIKPEYLDKYLEDEKN